MYGEAYYTIWMNKKQIVSNYKKIELAYLFTFPCKLKNTKVIEKHAKTIFR